MKRAANLLAIMVLMVCMMPFAQSVYASEYIKELGLSIEFPDGYEVVTRETVENGYSTEFMTNDKLLSYWQMGHIYASAVNKDDQTEIVATMTTSALPDFKTNTDEDLLSFADTLLSEHVSAYGVQATKYDLFKTNQTTFLRVWYPNTFGKNTFSLQYHTVLYECEDHRRMPFELKKILKRFRRRRQINGAQAEILLEEYMRPVPRSYASVSDPPLADTSESPPPDRPSFCGHCGASVVKNGRFCNKCGTPCPVEKESVV